MSVRTMWDPIAQWIGPVLVALCLLILTILWANQSSTVELSSFNPATTIVQKSTSSNIGVPIEQLQGEHVWIGDEWLPCSRIVSWNGVRGDSYDGPVDDKFWSWTHLDRADRYRYAKACEEVGW